MNNTTTTKPKMLTIKETAKTGILSEWALRGLVKQGKIPGIYVGNRFLINYDRLCDWLNNSGGEKA
ncbi:MAG: DNA-binding protein [Ruminococcaceae bacterium]|nr:DNA-binding protein [Oscillospiraceae bacterium]